jgi:hypothetical protein
MLVAQVGVLPARAAWALKVIVRLLPAVMAADIVPEDISVGATNDLLVAIVAVNDLAGSAEEILDRTGSAPNLGRTPAVHVPVRRPATFAFAKLVFPFTHGRLLSKVRFTRKRQGFSSWPTKYWLLAAVYKLINLKFMGILLWKQLSIEIEGETGAAPALARGSRSTAPAGPARPSRRYGVSALTGNDRCRGSVSDFPP